MATTIDKEKMIALLQDKLGDGIDLSGITDDDVSALLVITPDEDDLEDDDIPDDNGDDERDDELDKDDDDFEDNDIDLDDLDESQMTASEKMLYRALKKQTETNRKEKLNALIVSSDIDDGSKAMLKEMVSLGATKEKIEQLIAKTIESNNKNSRNFGAGTRMFSKKQAKLTKDITKQKIKIGSRAWGESLVK